MTTSKRREFEECAPVSAKGTVILNPPYGERIGGEDQMKTLYSQIGDVFKKRFTGWEGYVFTGNPEQALENASAFAPPGGSFCTMVRLNAARCGTPCIQGRSPAPRQLI